MTCCATALYPYLRLQVAICCASVFLGVPGASAQDVGAYAAQYRRACTAATCLLVLALNPLNADAGHNNRAAAAAVAAEAARAAARLEAIAKTPLWAHSLGCCMLSLGCIALAGYLTRRLHKWADAAQAQEVIRLRAN